VTGLQKHRDSRYRPDTTCGSNYTHAREYQFDTPPLSFPTRSGIQPHCHCEGVARGNLDSLPPDPYPLTSVFFALCIFSCLSTLSPDLCTLFFPCPSHPPLLSLRGRSPWQSLFLFPFSFCTLPYNLSCPSLRHKPAPYLIRGESSPTVL